MKKFSSAEQEIMGWEAYDCEGIDCSHLTQFESGICGHFILDKMTDFSPLLPGVFHLCQLIASCVRNFVLDLFMDIKSSNIPAEFRWRLTGVFKQV